MRHQRRQLRGAERRCDLGADAGADRLAQERASNLTPRMLAMSFAQPGWSRRPGGPGTQAVPSRVASLTKDVVATFTDLHPRASIALMTCASACRSSHVDESLAISAKQHG